MKKPPHGTKSMKGLFLGDAVIIFYQPVFRQGVRRVRP